MTIANLNRANWRTWRFDQMAVNVNDRIDNPAEANVEHYVGLEHLDTDSLKIRRWGVPSDVEATKLRFRKGDIIFGRRRVYQRKVGVAEFDGICSAHAMVLRPKSDVVVPEFLPFFLQSNAFMNRALQISVGSLSPTINWRTLANQEFALPPLGEQRRAVVTLVALENLARATQIALDSAIATEASFLTSVLGLYAAHPPQWPLAELREVAYIQTGAAKGRKPEVGKTIDVPYIGVSNVQDGYLDLAEINTITIEADRLERYQLQEGDLLLTEGGDPDKLGRGTIWQGEISGCIHQNHIFAVRPNLACVRPLYLAAVARSGYAKQYFLSCAKRTSNLATINLQQVNSFLLPVPPLSTQDSVLSDWLTIRDASVGLQRRLGRAKNLQTSLLDSYTEGMK